MPGGYTHITVAQLAIEEGRSKRKGLLHDDAKRALAKWKKFVIVGAVCPDYPYLNLLSGESEDWANAMHKGNAVDMLREAVKGVRAIPDNNTRQKCLAWLFGFASHVATDGTIHPVVNLKVGEYETHKLEHRTCEMSQDVFIHDPLKLGTIEVNKQISTNVQQVSDPNNPDRMDPDIARLWQDSLNVAYRGHQPALPSPDVHAWHRAMRQMIRIAESGNMLFPFARHMVAENGIVYPASPDQQYIQNLEVPSGARMDFKPIFDKALENVLELWGWLSLSLQGQPSPLDTVANWSLDTGIDENDHMVYWS
ncbi:MAG: zinc dependent phospholipase C family protein [Pseudomonadota bacterium]|nr:zinc dependent phospholipase C family protein [Gammaproteobacteria bacterium]MBU1731856.1 zinc dependent phospholipase C family protein [Gammaproteobacteria bacterium]MBU1892467.1 zinc dependent phospholipase C family protein [Gammaproteobacteria bacterium]